jgi:hypothetical protein
MISAATLTRGAAAGLFATGVMSMAIGRRPAPRDVARGVGRSIGSPAEEALDAGWPVAHAAMGASLGVLYAACRPFLPRSDVTAGAVFGAAAWISLYGNLLPVLGIYPSPARDSARRAARTATLHIIYGVSLAAFDTRLARP